MSYLKKSLSISLNKFGLKKRLRLKKLVSKSLSLGLEKFGPKKSLGIGLKKFGLKKSLDISLKNNWSKKKSRYRSRKHLVSKKSLGIGLENIWSRKQVSVSVSMKFSGLVTQCSLPPSYPLSGKLFCQQKP